MNRLRNRPFTEVDLVIERVERALLNTIRSVERSEAESKRLVLKWWKFGWLLCKNLFKSTMRRVVKIRKLWSAITLRVLRRVEEAKRLEYMNGLVDSWTPMTWPLRRPSSWPKRRKFRCPICIIRYIQETDRKQRRTLKGNAYTIFEDLPSQCCSMGWHVQSCHTDGGRQRVCVACGKRCASEEGMFKHQLKKHLSVDSDKCLQ